MLKLPGTDKRNLLEEEVNRMLDIMSSKPIDSAEYSVAFARFKELHAEELEEKKIKETRRSRWFDAIATGLLAGATMSYEYWAPITSKWGSSITRPFRHGFKLGFRQPK